MFRHSFLHLFWHSICRPILTAYSGILFWHLFWHSLRHGHCRASNASARSQWPGSWGRAATDLGSSRLSSIPAELRSLQLPEKEEKKEEKEATLTKSSDPHVAGYQKSIVQRGQCWSHWNTLLLPGLNKIFWRRHAQNELLYPFSTRQSVRQY